MHRRKHSRSRAVRRVGISVFGLALLACCAPEIARAQPALPQTAATRVVPPPSYFFVFGDYFDGEFTKAGKDFNAEGRGAIKDAQGNWIDSICFHTMVGECYYQMGKLPQALDHYNQALALYLAFPDWMIRVQFPPTIRRANVGQIFNCPWGVSNRNAVVGNYPNTMSIGQGRINNNQQVQQGGAVQLPMLYPVNVQEIVRCTTLAMRRKRELLGPASPHDRQTNAVYAALSRRPGPGNHWGDVWVSVELGIAASAAGKDPAARTELEQSVVAAGEFDHPLSCIALLELGRLDLKEGNLQSAADRFLEASISAGQFGDIGIIEESLRLGLTVHLLMNRPGVYSPLEPAAAWARREGYLHLQANLLTMIAENYTSIGEANKAMEVVASARGAVSRRAMGSGRTGARLSYATAQALYAQRQPDKAAAMLDAAMNYQSEGSIWLFQLYRADAQYISGEIQARVAKDLYAELLRDPQAADWATDPMEAMALLVHPHADTYENWFAAALEHRDPERAFEIADLVRRHRFLSTLEFGGRLTGLRWLLDGPTELLDPQATLERQELLASFPAYQELAQRADALRAQLRQLPAKSADADQQRNQAKLLTEWAKISLEQEQLLREIAVRRKAASLLFPPVRSIGEVQGSLAPGTALLSFLNTEKHGSHAFLITAEKGKYELWDIPDGATFQKKLTAYLRALGNYDSNVEVDQKILASEDWRAPGFELWKLLTAGCKTELPGNFTELAIVPDGALWYLPFESLPASEAEDAEPLLTQIK
ncbi:MAG: tetratricopeptide repeat protein, partial [Planctomycetia bacterium]|nr:tetratricopeptide repeat protein [Planctomycetia bacterium]